MERERAHWERGRDEWVRENRREEEEGEGRRKVGHEDFATSFELASLMIGGLCDKINEQRKMNDYFQKEKRINARKIVHFRKRRNTWRTCRAR